MLCPPTTPNRPTWTPPPTDPPDPPPPHRPSLNPPQCPPPPPGAFGPFLLGGGGRVQKRGDGPPVPSSHVYLGHAVSLALVNIRHMPGFRGGLQISGL